MDTTPQDRIRGHLEAARRAVLAELDAITDPVKREAAAREVITATLPELRSEVQAYRAGIVTGLREGRTLAEVGRMLGGLTAARVDQILKGK
jgi:DNA-directed RNA polymerase sigma subunit (sigma70/sigma32)